MKFRLIIMSCILAVAFMGCSNWTARNMGGTSKIAIEPNQKVVNATWKNSDLWVLTRPMRSGEVAETVTFREFSNMGVLSGTVVFVESVK